MLNPFSPRNSCKILNSICYLTLEISLTSWFIKILFHSEPPSIDNYWWCNLRFGFMVFNATFNNISVIISWRSVLLVVETGVPRENHRPVACPWLTFQVMLYRVHLAWTGFELRTTSVVIYTDCKGSCKSNYHTVTSMTAPKVIWRLMIIISGTLAYTCIILLG